MVARKSATGRIGERCSTPVRKPELACIEGTYYKYHVPNWDGQTKLTGSLKMAVDETDAIMATGKYEIYNTGHPEKDYYDVFVMEDKTNLKEAILPVTYLDGKRKHGMVLYVGAAKHRFLKRF